MAGFGEARFEIGSVISRTFETIGANALLFIGLALILAGLPAFATNWWQFTNLPMGGSADPGRIFSAAYLGPVFAGGLVALISGAVLQAALTRATVTYLSGEKPDFGRCLTAGLTMILPMIGISILLGFGVGLAMLLLIVPGIILWLCWSVVVPVYVQEKVGVFEAFGRSLELTRGWRWRIFLTMLVIMIGLWLVSIPTGLVTSGVFAANGSVLTAAVLNGAIGALGNMVFVTAQASIYVELRNVKDGVAPAELEAIFA